MSKRITKRLATTGFKKKTLKFKRHKRKKKSNIAAYVMIEDPASPGSLKLVKQPEEDARPASLRSKPKRKMTKAGR